MITAKNAKEKVTSFVEDETQNVEVKIKQAFKQGKEYVEVPILLHHKTIKNLNNAGYEVKEKLRKQKTKVSWANLLTIICLLFMHNAFPQENDLRIQHQIDSAHAYSINHFVQLNLGICHDEFRTGTQINIIGGIIVTGGVILSFQNIDKSVPISMNVIGGILGLIGTIYWIDSHKYIGYASEVKSY